MNALDVLNALEKDTTWVNQLVKYVADSKYWPYSTTDARLFREVTIRKPTGKTNRFGQERLKRYRLDGVTVIKINDHRYEPLIVGIEVKVSKSDLKHDKKMVEYADHCDLLFLAVPTHLKAAAKDYIADVQNTSGDLLGCLLIDGNDVQILSLPVKYDAPAENRRNIMTELLMKSLWKEAKQKQPKQKRRKA